MAYSERSSSDNVGAGGAMVFLAFPAGLADVLFDAVRLLPWSSRARSYGVS